jgi:hypothetical protein
MNKNRIFLVKYHQESGSYKLYPAIQGRTAFYTVFIDGDDWLNVYVSKETPEDALVSAKQYFDAFILESKKVETVEDLKPILYEMLEVMAELNLYGSSQEAISNKLVKLSILLRNKND